MTVPAVAVLVAVAVPPDVELVAETQFAGGGRPGPEPKMDDDAPPHGGGAVEAG